MAFGTWDKLALFRFDSKGDTVWIRIYTDSARLEGWWVKIARHNRYLLGCNWFQQKTYYFYTPALTLTDSLGNRLWTKTYNADSNHARMLLGIDTCKDGGYILTTYDYDTNYPGQEQANIAVIKTDSNGNLLWTKFIPPPYYLIEGWNIMSLREGGYIICGEQGTKNNWPFNYPQMYMTKLNDTGGVVWAKTYSYSSLESGGANLEMTRELSNGDIIACGEITSPSSADSLRGCILKIDSNGNQKWLQFYYIQFPQEQDYLFDIEPTTDGGFVACGSTYGVTANTWVIKVDSLGCDSGCNNNTGTEELRTKSEGVSVFPNPNNGNFSIQLSDARGKQSIELYNVFGEKIYVSKINAGNTEINVGKQPNGIYLYRIISESGELLSEGKIIIQK